MHPRLQGAAWAIMTCVNSSTDPQNPLWGPQPTISDGQMTLRPFRPGDAWAMVEWDADPETQRFFEYPALPPPDEHLRRARWVVGEFRRGYERGERIAYVVTDARSSEPLGTVEFHDIQHDAAEISFMTVPARRREGVARRAVELLCSRAVRRFGLTRITLQHHPDNRASEIVARRTGFREVARVGASVRHAIDLSLAPE
jgi:RimJ/RimL family protein N-acetyltransferase